MIESIFGPMFAGKTSELMRKIKRHRLAQKKCLVINYFADNRYSTEPKITSHDQLSIDAIKVKQLCEVPKNQLEDVQVIGIDEGQFFTDLIEQSEKWANEGKIVIVAALDCTYQKKPFNKVTDLLALSEKVTKLTAVCMDCGKDAAFTKRISSEGEIELIGGLDKYKPVCRACFHNESKAVDLEMNKVNLNVMDKQNINGEEKLKEEVIVTPKKVMVKVMKENVRPFVLEGEMTGKGK